MSINQIVTIACYDPHLKYLQDLDCRRLLLCSGFNRLYSQVKEVSKTMGISVACIAATKAVHHLLRENFLEEGLCT